MEAEKVLISIEAGMEQLSRLDVFGDTGAFAGRRKVEEGLHMIRLAVEHQAAREGLLNGESVQTLGDKLE